MKHQLGFSMVELLVSSVIGLFLLGGVATNFLSTKDTDKMRGAISEMDDSAHLVFESMRRSIQHAGYPSIHSLAPFNTSDSPFFYTANAAYNDNPNCNGGGLQRDDPGSTPTYAQRTRDRFRGDVITVVARADNPCADGQAACAAGINTNPRAHVYVDCTGGGSLRNARTVACSSDPVAGIADDGKIFSTFYLGGTAVQRRNGTLMCRGSRGGTQPIADNIESMQILYGVKEDDGSSVYRRANRIRDNDQWNIVSSVQIAILVRSSDTVLKKPTNKVRYNLLGRNWVITGTDSEGRDKKLRLYRVYTTTINMANTL